MRTLFLASIVAIVAMAGCAAPATPNTADEDPGIAVGEPDPAAGGGIEPASECRMEQAPEGERGPAVNGVGTVTLIDLEGGFWGIVAEDGIRYDPVNLCKEFQTEGVKIHFGGAERPDMSSSHAWGTLLELDWVQTFHESA